MGLVAISPHLDDVALGCADLVAASGGAVVVTVTAGRPGLHPLTAWDRQCGFGPDDDVVGARRAEDEAALAELGACPLWLDFLDHQYGPPPAHRQLVESLGGVVADQEATVVASPLGLFHEDHVMTAAACISAARQSRVARWLLYEDAIYRAVDGRAAAALGVLETSGWELDEVTVPPAGERKRRAITLYTSQVRGLATQLDDAYLPERYWELRRAR